MKTKELLAIAFLGLAIVSCNQDEFAQEVHEKPAVEQNTPEKVAKFLTSIPLSENIVKEVHNVVSAALKSNTEESYAFKEILSENGGGEIMTRAGVQKSLLGELMKQYANTPDVRSGNEIVALDLSQLEESNLQIYWPYSENWDGVTPPTITFLPEDEDQEWNIGYFVEDGEIDTLLVDEDFAEKRPLWVINLRDTIFKEYIPEGISGENQQFAEAAAIGDPVYTTYLGKFMASEQHDAFWAGGSEFVVLVGTPSDFSVSESGRINFNSDIVRLPVYRSRKDIRKKRWVDLYQPIVSDWTDDIKEIAFVVVEEDQGSSANETVELSATWLGKEYKFGFSLPTRSRDDIITNRKYARSYVFSTNNHLGGDWKEGNWYNYTSRGVNWTVPYKIGRVLH